MRFILGLVIALAMSSVSWGADKGKLPSTRDYFKHAEYGTVRISPTGRYLAATVPTDGTTSLAIIDLKSNDISAVFSVGRDEHVAWANWATDERVVFGTTLKLGSLDRPVGTGNLYAADADGGKRIQLLGGEGGRKLVTRGFSITSLLEDEPDYILVQIFNASRYYELYKVDITAGTKVRVGLSPVREGRLLADRSGQVRLAIGSSEDAETVVMYRENNEAEWKEIDRSTSSDGGITPLAFVDDNQKILVAANVETPALRLELLDPKSGARTPLFADDRYDVMDDLGRMMGYDQLLMARDNETPIGVAYEAALPQYHFFDPQHPDVAIYAGLLQAFPEQRVRFGNFTDDGEKLVLKVDSDRNPGEFYLYDAKAQRVSWLVAAMPWIDPKQMLPMRAVTFTARDGLEIPAYLSVPPGEAKDLPFIVLPHGGPHGPRDYWSWNPEAQFFASHGYAVLQVNFRGSGGLGREFETAGYRKWGREMQDDLTDATLWAVEQGIADPERLCIYGASYGGYAALMGAVREPDLYKCAVGYVGVYDISYMFEEGDYLDNDRKASLTIMELFHGTDEADWRARSPVYNVDKIKADLMIVTGKKDRRVPFEHHKRLVKALDEAGKSYETLIENKEAHGFYDVDNRVELYDRMLKFFDRNIGSGAKR